MGILPTSTGTRDLALKSQIIVAYGPPKIGKSTFFKPMPNALYIDTENGLKWLDDIFKMPVRTKEQFDAVMFEFFEGKHNFDTIIIDTIDGLLNIYENHYRKTMKAEYDEFGRGVVQVRKDLRRLIEAMMNSKYGLIMIGHTSTKDLKTSAGVSIPQTTLDGTYKTSQIITSKADFIMAGEKDVVPVKLEDGSEAYENTRFWNLRGSPYVDAGVRAGYQYFPAQIGFDYDNFAQVYADACLMLEACGDAGPVYGTEEFTAKLAELQNNSEPIPTNEESTTIV